MSCRERLAVLSSRPVLRLRSPSDLRCLQELDVIASCFQFVFLRSSQSARCSRPYFELPGWAGGGRLSWAAAAGLRRLTRTLQATGGEMFERIGSRAHFSETEAARCFYQVITAARLGQPHPTPCHRHERCIRGILERERSRLPVTVQITNCYTRLE
jgi:hypothetical protein